MQHITSLALMLLLVLNSLADGMLVLCTAADDDHVAIELVGHGRAPAVNRVSGHQADPAAPLLDGDTDHHHHDACIDRSLSALANLQRGADRPDLEAPPAVALPPIRNSHSFPITAAARPIQPRAPPAPHMAAVERFCSLRLLI